MQAKLDSKSLFRKQMADHTKALSKLLEARADRAVDGAFMEKCIVSTKMLTNSASLLKLSRWEELLRGYESLLMSYRNGGLRWDERIAQITSEIIEKEESLESTLAGGDGGDLDGAIAEEELHAFLQELNLVLEGLSSCDERTHSESEAMDGTDGSLDETPKTVERPVGSRASDSKEADTPPPDFIQVPGNRMAELVERLNSARRERLDGEEGGIPASSDMEREAELIEFYVSSLVDLIEIWEGGSSYKRAWTSLEPLQEMISLLGDVLSMSRGRRIDVSLDAADTGLESGLLIEAWNILVRMIEDICMRSEGDFLRIEVGARSTNGAVWWSLRDNGENFISDSRLDKEDFLAFYPGLKEVRKWLAVLSGVLWVEPFEDRDTRFAFTLPSSVHPWSFHVWRSDNAKLAVPSSQVCAIIEAARVDKRKIPSGEELVLDGKKIPLVTLGLIAPGAPESGRSVVVAGHLEKRIAFYVDGSWSLEEGVWKAGKPSLWRRAARGTAAVGGEELDVVEAGTLIDSYLRALGDRYENGLSGEAVGTSEAEDARDRGPDHVQP